MSTLENCPSAYDNKHNSSLKNKCVYCGTIREDLDHKNASCIRIKIIDVTTIVFQNQTFKLNTNKYKSVSYNSNGEHLAWLTTKHDQAILCNPDGVNVNNGTWTLANVKVDKSG